jgi:peptidoglycan hydrolase-like amidase
MRRVWVAAFCLIAIPLLGQPGAENAQVRIGVLGLFHTNRIIVQRVAGQPLECGAPGEKRPIPMQLEMVTGGPQISEPSISPLGSEQTFSCDNGAGGETDFILSLPGKISRQYRGRAEFYQHQRELLMVVTMKLETAVASVVAAESPPGAPLEALKAQAVAARSFLVAGKGNHRSFDFCDTTHCQFLRAPPAPGSPPNQAAADTQGLVLTYRDSEFAAMYSASCSGRTHSLRELGIPVRGYPYFSVTCSYCRRHPQSWSAKLRQQDAVNLVPGENARLKLARQLGWKTVPSNSYAARSEGGAVVLEGVGVGHGIGLCQRGAADMAKHGSSFREILAHYYPNTALKQLP